MGIRIYNTLTRRKEDFQPRHPGEVSFYSCGPTVYNYIHIGNARTFIMSDVIRRYLLYCGYKVKFVMNVTDIDDRIIKQSNEEGIEFHAVAKKYTDAFLEDIQNAGMRMPDIIPKVTDHLPQIIELVQKLIANGHAYELQGSVYYDVTRFEGYGKLSGKNIDDLQAGARVEVDETKRSPLDFVLWKASKPGEPWWESPWGKGRPGWHIECSAMCMKHLSEQVDIHTGGADLIFPHHENEIAQSEGATNKTFVKYWMHFGFLNVNDEKMSKSLGNFWLLRDALKHYRPEVLRLLFLQKHYASPLNFSEEALNDVQSAHKRIEGIFERLEKAIQTGATSKDPNADAERFAKELERLENDIVDAMNDDFNTAAALGKIFEVFHGVSRILSSGKIDSAALKTLEVAQRSIRRWNDVLGILNISQPAPADKNFEALMDLIIEVRREMRLQKNWAMSDLIRDRLNAIGVAIEDTPDATTWKFK